MQRDVSESATAGCISTNLPRGSFMNIPFASYRGKARAPLARKVLGMALAGLFIVPNQGRAAAGDLDTSFGTGGKVTTDFAGSFDVAHAVTLQPDGKIVAAGGAFVSVGEGFVVEGYNMGGLLDKSFGAGGIVTNDFDSDFDEDVTVALHTAG